MAVAVGPLSTAVPAVTDLSLRNLDGELRAFQAMLAAFSLHSVTHLGQAALFRGYTPAGGPPRA